MPGQILQLSRLAAGRLRGWWASVIYAGKISLLSSGGYGVGLERNTEHLQL